MAVRSLKSWSFVRVALTIYYSITLSKLSPMMAISMLSIVSCEMNVAAMKKRYARIACGWLPKLSNPNSPRASKY